MRTITLSVIVGMTALMMLAPFWGVASAQINSGAAAIGVATSGPFSLVKGGFGHGGFAFGRGFGFYGGGPYGYGYSGYGSGYFDYPNYGTRTEPGQTCLWSGYEWKCYKSDNNYYNSY
jgi:hypothetical protein